MRLVPLFLLLAGAAVAPAARAAPPSPPTVAVLPFVDLSGRGGSVGEAIRETVTSDLRAVPGLRVVERARLDELLGEQARQAHAELDVPRAVAVGRLVGATLIATGAYQRVGDDVRLTARFVSVESGVVVGSAKIDGAARDLLALQDRITGELARSAGFAWSARPHARLGSLRGVELYGDALLARDDQRRHELLREAITVEPQLDYAVRDLDDLERRMQQLVARAEHERERLGLERVAQLAARVGSARDDAARVAAYDALFDELHRQYRFRRLNEEARAVLDRPPLARGSAHFAHLDERARWELILTSCLLKRDIDRVLVDGERFLAAYPTSHEFAEVKQLMDYAIRWKRKAESGPRNAEARLAALPLERRADPCVVGHIYHEERQLAAAAAEYERCVADPRADQGVLQNLVAVYLSMPDFKSARRIIALANVRFPGLAEREGAAWKELPVDAD